MYYLSKTVEPEWSSVAKSEWLADNGTAIINNIDDLKDNLNFSARKKAVANEEIKPQVLWFFAKPSNCNFISSLATAFFAL